MRLIDAYTNTVFRNYFRFDGRMSRAEFWGFAICDLIILSPIILVGILGERSITPIDWIDFFYMFATTLPRLGAQARRLHDVNLSAWLILLNFLPYIGSAILLIIYILPAKPEGAKYGPYHDSGTH
jgi:uncharacterized membrane protein YhaH (DUF805 family)